MELSKMDFLSALKSSNAFEDGAGNLLATSCGCTINGWVKVSFDVFSRKFCFSVGGLTVVIAGFCRIFSLSNSDTVMTLSIFLKENH
jgi:hypothetical protein